MPLREHDAPDPDGAGDRGGADELALARERAGAGRDCRIEPGPGQQAGQQEDDVGIFAGRAVEDLHEDEVVDPRHQQRIEDRPQVAEGRGRVSDLQIS